MSSLQFERTLLDLRNVVIAMGYVVFTATQRSKGVKNHGREVLGGLRLDLETLDNDCNRVEEAMGHYKLSFRLPDLRKLFTRLEEGQNPDDVRKKLDEWRTETGEPFLGSLRKERR